MKRFGVIAGKKEFDCGTTRCWLHSCLGSMQKSGVRGNDQGVRIERKARGPTFVVYGSAEQTRRQVSVRRPRKVCREKLSNCETDYGSAMPAGPGRDVLRHNPGYRWSCRDRLAFRLSFFSNSVRSRNHRSFEGWVVSCIDWVRVLRVRTQWSRPDAPLSVFVHCRPEDTRELL